ncbi:hypothetical protein NEHOM01_0554 [Nematocida homosporus]|uniref:uncharacterized protein n=1 Tax=Nematocida homosporus TaxID=1912981 RepID=UPI00221F7741|nr:uncharacterized protein NEHOM01_0554 [Nematocida homosporus]KAI5185003.1 hypothetical protein NEHOM01_0554 [Nematocida homosporus]
MESFKEVATIGLLDSTFVLIDRSEVEVRQIEDCSVLKSLPRGVGEYKTLDNQLIRLNNGEMIDEFNQVTIATFDKSWEVYWYNQEVYQYRIRNGQLEIRKISKQTKTNKKISIELCKKSSDSEYLLNKSFYFYKNLCYYYRDNNLYYQSLDKAGEELVLRLPNLKVTALSHTESSPIIALSDGTLLVVNLLTKTIKPCKWHSKPVSQIVPVSGELIVSLAVNGTFLLTDCDSLANTFLCTTNQPVLEFKVSSLGYLIYTTPVSIVIFDIAAKTARQTIYLLTRATKVVPVEHTVAEEPTQYVPSLSGTETNASPIITCPSQDKILIPGHIYVLHNLLVFHSPTLGIYRVHTEIATIKDLLLSHDHLLVVVSAEEEKIARQDNPKRTSSYSPSSLSNLYKLIRLEKNYLALIAKEELNELQNQQLQDLSTNLNRTIITTTSQTTPNQAKTFTYNYPLAAYYGE